MRRREIHPDFWTDERVIEVSDGAKLLFIGLWMVADRAGRLERKTVAIGLKLRPWDPTAVPHLLEELVVARLVLAYEVGGRHYLGLPGLVRRQRFHPRELKSFLPPWPPEVEGARRVQANLGDPRDTSSREKANLGDPRDTSSREKANLGDPRDTSSREKANLGDPRDTSSRE
ncbi:MAG: hypothetical protein ACRD4T_00005, partial [Candidatus Acidiferrales bacterium]